jgi:hypothetical protein
MSGPSSKPKRNARKAPVFVPHPDDVEAVQEGIEAAERDDALSAEESAAYVHALVGDEPSSTK